MHKYDDVSALRSESTSGEREAWLLGALLTSRGVAAGAALGVDLFFLLPLLLLNAIPCVLLASPRGRCG